MKEVLKNLKWSKFVVGILLAIVAVITFVDAILYATSGDSEPTKAIIDLFRFGVGITLLFVAIVAISYALYVGQKDKAYGPFIKGGLCLGFGLALVCNFEVAYTMFYSFVFGLIQFFAIGLSVCVIAKSVYVAITNKGAELKSWVPYFAAGICGVVAGIVFIFIEKPGLVLFILFLIFGFAAVIAIINGWKKAHEKAE